MATETRTSPMDSAVADRLLDLLSTDDDYRARFQANPRIALEEIGYQSPAMSTMAANGAMRIAVPEALIDCRVENLAPKEVISAGRNEIKTMLLRGLAQQTPQLDTGLATGLKLIK
jgi:putative modified peptide